MHTFIFEHSVQITGLMPVIKHLQIFKIIFMVWNNFDARILFYIQTIVLKGQRAHNTLL